MLIEEMLRSNGMYKGLRQIGRKCRWLLWSGTRVGTKHFKGREDALRLSRVSLFGLGSGESTPDRAPIGLVPARAHTIGTTMTLESDFIAEQ